MSAWRLVVMEIHRFGPMQGDAAHSSSLQNARVLGLIEHDEKHRWQLTPLGLEYCEGRVVQVEVRPGGRRFVATWLRSLPQGISI